MGAGFGNSADDFISRYSRPLLDENGNPLTPINQADATDAIDVPQPEDPNKFRQPIDPSDLQDQNTSDLPNPKGFMLPQQYQGSDVDPSVAREARARALIAFGAPLLGAGGTKNPGALLGQGLQAFDKSMSGSLESAAAADRQAEQDKLNRMVVQQRITTEQHADTRAETELGMKQDEANRLSTEKESANGVVSGLRDIVSEKAPDSTQAMKLGVYADSENPHLFVADALKEYNEWAAINNMPTVTAAEIEAKQAEIKAGVMIDPRKQQAMESQRIGLEGANIGSEISHRTWEENQGAKQESASRIDGMLQNETNTLFSKSIGERNKRFPAGLVKPDGTGLDMTTGKMVHVPTDDEIRQQAMAQAQINVQRRMQSTRSIQGNTVALIPSTVQKIKQKMTTEPVDQIRREMMAVPGMTPELLERYIGAAGSLQ